MHKKNHFPSMGHRCLEELSMKPTLIVFDEVVFIIITIIVVVIIIIIVVVAVVLGGVDTVVVTEIKIINIYKNWLCALIIRLNIRLRN